MNLSLDFLRRLPFTHEQRWGRFSAQMRSQQHRNLQSVQAMGGAAYRGTYSAAEICSPPVSTLITKKLSWYLRRCFLSVWHCFFILRYFFSFLFFQYFVSVRNIAPTRCESCGGSRVLPLLNGLLQTFCGLLTRWLVAKNAEALTQTFAATQEHVLRLRVQCLSERSVSHRPSAPSNLTTWLHNAHALLTQPVWPGR